MRLNHFGDLMVFALLVSVALAFLSKRTARERLTYTVYAFLAFVLVAIALGWVMYPFSR
jgi:Kef-type K+ transport system membrane component KefB